MRIVFTTDQWSATKNQLLARLDVETCAIAIARSSHGRLIVHDVLHPEPGDYLNRSAVSAQLKPDFIFEAGNTARQTDSSLVFIHTHPFDLSVPTFSPVDDAGERRLIDFFDRRLPERDHGAIVLSPGGLAARSLGADAAATVVSVGRKLRIENGSVSELDDRFDRQVRAFGAEGQAAIAALKIGIVGLGGTGSVTAQQLALLGVRDFVLIDFDRVDKTSLNRLVGATRGDIGMDKIEVAKRQILEIDPDSSVEMIGGDIADDGIARKLLDRDLIFGCTDSHASRAILGQIAYQYLIPVIDMGVSLSVRDGKLAKVTGRTQLLAPGLPCFLCLELLDSETIRREMLTSELRSADPYIDGAHEPQPSVISLNSTVSSLAVSMFLGAVTEAPLDATFLRYDGMKGLVKPLAGMIDPGCYVCSSSNALGRGDQWPLPTRSPGP
jgi:molybdopterin/thiamine biosynthesis adenylyltransferase